MVGPPVILEDGVVLTVVLSSPVVMLEDGVVVVRLDDGVVVCSVTF